MECESKLEEFIVSDIVEIISNPIEHLKTTNKYIGEPAEIVSIITKGSAYLLRFCDDRMMTVDISCLKKIE